MEHGDVSLGIKLVSLIKNPLPADLSQLQAVVYCQHDADLVAALEFVYGVMPQETQRLFLTRLRLRAEFWVGVLTDEARKGQERERQVRRQAMMAPSEHGTVAELAARCGVSKAEIRRQRAMGTLEAFLALQVVTAEG